MVFSVVSFGLIDAAFRPSTFVQAQVDTYTNSWWGQISAAGRLSAVYFLNLILYAGPLTLSGFGTSARVLAPGPWLITFLDLFFTDPFAAFYFIIRLLQNSAYLFVASVLVFVTFHVGVMLTRSSVGVLQSIHTVIYSVGIYLAAVFTLVWYLSTAEQIAVADDWLIALQKSYIYFFIDVFSFGVDLPGGRPSAVNLALLTRQGQVAIGALVIATLYFIYSLYLGARINHHASRFEGLVALGTVTLSPAVYVIGSILMAVLIDSQEILSVLAI